MQVLDDTHAQIQLSAPAQRIISLAPNLTEILFFIGAGDRVVGTVDHSDYPPAALQVPRVGSHSRFDFETILRLQPDLILAWESGNPAALVTRLEQLGLTVYRAEPATLALIASTLVRIGKLTGNDKTANRLAGQFLEEAESIRKTFHRKKLIRVFYQVWHNPLITLNGDHLVSRLLEDCGAQQCIRRICRTSPPRYPESQLSAVTPRPLLLETVPAGPIEHLITGQTGTRSMPLRMGIFISSIRTTCTDTPLESSKECASFAKSLIGLVGQARPSREIPPWRENSDRARESPQPSGKTRLAGCSPRYEAATDYPGRM